MERFRIFMERGFFPNEAFELYTIGIIQGLVYGMCAVPCGTTLWDCERFDKFVMFPVDCTADDCEKLMEVINRMHPGICYYDKQEES